MARLTFTEDMVVTHMRSSEGEVVLLTQTINTNAARGQVRIGDRSCNTVFTNIVGRFP